MPIPVTWLDEQTVNTVTAGIQNAPKVIQLTNGNIVVAWVSDSDTGAGSPIGLDIIGQIFDPLGVKIGSEFRLNAASVADNEQDVDLAAMPGGGFVIVYHDVDFINGGSNIRLEEFDAVGTNLLENAEVVGDTGAPALPNYANPRVAVSSATSVLIIYDEVDASGISHLRGKIYDPTTDTYGAQLGLIGGAPTGNTGDGAVTVLTNGNYVIAGRFDTADDAIYYRIISSTGANVRNATIVGGTNGDGFVDSDPEIVALTGGGFAISYTSLNGSDSDIIVRTYDATGAQVGVSNVDTVPSAVRSYNESTIARLADGGFVVAYDNDSDGELEATTFNSTGTYQTNNSLVALNASALSAIGLADGRFAVTWWNGAGDVSLEILDGRSSINLTGVYTGAQWQVGTVGNDTVTLDSTTDIAHGGLGNDTISATGLAQIFGDEGNDIVRASVTNTGIYDGGAGVDTIDLSPYTGTYNLNLVTGLTNFGSDLFTNFENANGTASANTIIGTSASNVIEGLGGDDYLIGSGGDDQLFGGAGINQLQGGTGSDFYYVSSNSDSVIEFLDEGNDYVYPVGLSVYVLPANIENLNGVNAAIGFLGIGNILDNSIIGKITTSDNLYGRDGNDSLAGLAGAANTLIGGTGNDTYIVEAVGDSTIELPSEGNDTVRTTFGIYALQANIENLTLTDTGAHAAGVGNDLGNTLRGNTGADSLFGRLGDDSLYGGTGAANTLLGQEGSDTYYVDAVGDSVIEFASQGTDTVVATTASFTLPNNVEYLTFTGSSPHTGIGNALSNIIIGGAGADFLSGLDGMDTLIGGSGADELLGGAGADTFQYQGGETGVDRIYDFAPASDLISLNADHYTPTAVRGFVQGAAPVALDPVSTFLYNTGTGMVSYDDDGTGAAAPILIAQLNAGLALSLANFGFYSVA